MFKTYYKKYEKYLLVLLPLLAVLLLFCRSVDYKFYQQMDDYLYVVGNKHLALNCNNFIFWFQNSCMDLYTPLPMISYMFDHAIWDNNVIGYHLQNIFWHMFAVITVYVLLIRLGLSFRTACFFTVVFAIHPQRIESVVWISERKDVMCGTFYFLSLLTWLKSLNNGRIFNVWTLLFMIAAVLSKPIGVTLPAVMCCIFIYRDQDFIVLLKKKVWCLWPYIMVSLGYLLLITYVKSISKELMATDADYTRTIFLVLNNLMMYACKTFFPGDLVPLYPYFELSWSKVLIIFLFFSSLIILALFLYRRCKAFTLYKVMPPLLCFLIVLLPCLGFFAFSNADFADRYSYISSFFILWLTAIIVNRIFFSEKTEGKIVYCSTQIAVMNKYRRVVIMMPTLYLISLVVGNLFYLPSWQNDYTLLKKICDRDNANFRGMAAFACLELSNKNFSEALEIAERMREETWMTKSQKNAIKLFKEFVRGMVFYNYRDSNAAMACFSKLLVPEMPILNRLVRGIPAMAFFTIANIYLERGEKTHAADFFLKLSENIDDSTAKFFYCGLSAFLSGNLESAKINFSRALEISPNDDKSKANLLIVEQMLKEKQIN